jgi:hypothetical protein
MSRLDLLPIELLSEVLCRRDVISLLRLRRSDPDSREGRLLYLETFWEAYCTVRRWRFEKTRVVYSWEMIALVMDVYQMSLSCIEASLSDGEGSLLPSRCLRGLLDTIRLLHCHLELAILARIAQLDVERDRGAWTVKEEPVWDVERFSRPLAVGKKRYAAIKDRPWVVNVQARVPEVEKVRASRLALREMYEADTRRRQQSRSGWYPTKKGSARNDGRKR